MRQVSRSSVGALPRRTQCHRGVFVFWVSVEWSRRRRLQLVWYRVATGVRPGAPPCDMADSERFPLSQFALGGAKSQDAAEYGGRAQVAPQSRRRPQSRPQPCLSVWGRQLLFSYRHSFSIYCIFLRHMSRLAVEVHDVHDQVAAPVTSAVAEHH